MVDKGAPPVRAGSARPLFSRIRGQPPYFSSATSLGTCPESERGSLEDDAPPGARLGRASGRVLGAARGVPGFLKHYSTLPRPNYLIAKRQIDPALMIKMGAKPGAETQGWGLEGGANSLPFPRFSPFSSAPLSPPPSATPLPVLLLFPLHPALPLAVSYRFSLPPALLSA